MKPLEITNCPTTDPSLILPSVNQISRKREASIGVPVQSRNVHEASTGRYVKKNTITDLMREFELIGGVTKFLCGDVRWSTNV